MSGDISQQPTLGAIPRFYIWNGEMLFLGNFSIPHRAHKVVQEKLIVCLKGALTLQCPGGKRIVTRSCLLQTGVYLDTTQVDAGQAVVAIYYLQPFSQDYPALASVMQEAFPGVSFGHPLEDALAACFLSLRDGKPASPEEAYTKLHGLLVPSELETRMFREFDSRILSVVQTIRSAVCENHSLSDLAASVHLSESRLGKLFKDQIGLPVTQYRLRYRVFISVILLAQGYSVTEAALIAGFSNSAHFSRSFSAINGVQPSTTFMRPPFLETFIDDDIQALVKSIADRQPLP
ncbi:MAG TPA: AraC family transcriptional regulator [Marinobacter sp.]|nr:AraC family transcriptional regulator [Marinobacter sp.]